MKVHVSTQVLPDFDSWMDFTKRFLALYTHMALHREYALAGAATDSYGKLSAVIGQNAIIPRWLFDVCREMARPMYANGVCYLPWFNVDYDGSSSPISGFGLSPSIASMLGAILQDLDVEMRFCEEEALKPAPLFMGDGSYVLIDDDLAEFRLNAMMSLRSLRHGCHVYDGDSKDEKEHPVFRKKIRGAAMQMLQRPYDMLPDAQRDSQLIPQWDAGGPYDVISMIIPPEQRPLASSAIATSIAAGTYFYSPLLPEGRRTRLFLYWSETLMQTQAMVNEWLLRRTGARAGIPAPRTAASVVVYGVEYSQRFPTDTTHSSTPKKKGASQRVVKTRKRISNDHLEDLKEIATPEV